MYIAITDGNNIALLASSFSSQHLMFNYVPLLAVCLLAKKFPQLRLAITQTSLYGLILVYPVLLGSDRPELSY